MGVYKIKQYIIVRKDLEMPVGKLGAQTAHASVAALMKCATKNDKGEYTFNDVAKEWLNNDFAKVCLGVKNEAELEKYFKIAQENNLPCAYIVDNGTTVFNGVKTPTCVGIGPAQSDILEPLFKRLQLLK